MQMQDYLGDIEFATTPLITAIWGERNRLEKLQAEIRALSKAVELEYRKADAWARDGETPDDVAMEAGIRWANYFGNDKELYHKDESREELLSSISIHEFSVALLSGSLLQYAKQGISLVHGGLVPCPDGKSIGTQFLKDVIWQGRNQAIHWEEGRFNAPVEYCFQLLEQEIDARFNQFRSKNMAFDLVEHLGWTGVDRFQDDLLLLS